MDYKETPEEEVEDVNAGNEDLELEQINERLDKELDFEGDSDATFPDLTDLGQLAKKGKAQPNSRFSLKARRAIEDHLEQRRLHKEIDYMFDDDFTVEEENKPKS